MNDDSHFELPAPEVFGPQGEHVVALLDRARHLTPDEASALAVARAVAPVDVLDAAWGAELGGALDAAWGTGLGGALDDAGNAMSDAVLVEAGDDALAAALDTACALVVRGLITAEDYDTLTRPWREVIGPIHPDDPDMRQP